MSEEQLKAFLEAIKADAGLQEKLKAAKDADAVAEIAKAAGFVISIEALQGAKAELSDKELEGVTGGGENAMNVEMYGNLGAAILEIANGAFGWNIPNKYNNYGNPK